MGDGAGGQADGGRADGVPVSPLGSADLSSLDSPEVPSAGPPVRLPAWEAFEKEILVKSGVAEVLAPYAQTRSAGRPVAGHRHRH